MENNTQEQYIKITKFLKKNKAKMISNLIEKQIEEQGYWDILYFINNEGIHFIKVEDIE